MLMGYRVLNIRARPGGNIAACLLETSSGTLIYFYTLIYTLVMLAYIYKVVNCLQRYGPRSRGYHHTCVGYISLPRTITLSVCADKACILVSHHLQNGEFS